MEGNPDDIFEWADGTQATREDIDRGDYAFMSDDYVLVRVEGLEPPRLAAAGPKPAASANFAIPALSDHLSGV